MRLRSGIAVAVVYTGGCSFRWPPSLGTSIHLGCGPKKGERKKKERKKERERERKEGRKGEIKREKERTNERTKDKEKNLFEVNDL